jgi:hypothetical protein
MIAATLISLVHFLVIAWNFYAPFSSIPLFRVSYVVFAPFLMLHWVLNDDTCALTALECKLRGLEDCGESFVHKIVSPIYKITDAQVRHATWAFTAFAWLYALSRTSWAEVGGIFIPDKGT